jgi:hypothetical protein
MAVISFFMPEVHANAKTMIENATNGKSVLFILKIFMFDKLTINMVEPRKTPSRAKIRQTLQTG